MKLNQEKGLYQDQLERQIRFDKYKKIRFDFKKVPLKRVKRIVLHNNKIFILDGKRSELYVLNKRGTHLYTIGRPGQGPGDLEYPTDFFISGNNNIYVLNSIPRRIEIFFINSDPLDTIKIKPPSVWSFPGSILVDKKGSFILGGPLNHLIAIYNSKGDYQRSVLKRQKAEPLERNIIGVFSQLSFIDNQKKILHFDRFKGIFRLLMQTGNVKIMFSAYFDKIHKSIEELEKKIDKNSKKFKRNHIMYIPMWSNFCLDEQNNIYVVPYTKTKNPQQLFVFSSNGILLYRRELIYFADKDMAISNIFMDNDNFCFLTNNFDLIIANRSKT